MTSFAARIGGHRLPTATPLRSHDDDTADVDALLSTADGIRLVGLLARAVHDRAVVVDDSTRARIDDLHLEQLAKSLRAERALVDAVRVLRRAGIATRMLGGVALAHVDYSTPELRLFDFATVLVSPGDRARADEVVAHSDELVLRSDLLDEAQLGIDAADLFAPPTRFNLGALELEALPMPQRLLHVCANVARRSTSPVPRLRDVAELVLRNRPHVAEVAIMARRWHAETSVARTIVATWRELAIELRPPIVDWAERITQGDGDGVRSSE
ncbi:MAG: nucleotidyltransferase family protein [Acidimicrobiia bacterium]